MTCKLSRSSQVLAQRWCDSATADLALSRPDHARIYSATTLCCSFLNTVHSFSIFLPMIPPDVQCHCSVKTECSKFLWTNEEEKLMTSCSAEWLARTAFFPEYVFRIVENRHLFSFAISIIFQGLNEKPCHRPTSLSRSVLKMVQELTPPFWTGQKKLAKDACWNTNPRSDSLSLYSGSQANSVNFPSEGSSKKGLQSECSGTREAEPSLRSNLSVQRNARLLCLAAAHCFPDTAFAVRVFTTPSSHFNKDPLFTNFARS